MFRQSNGFQALMSVWNQSVLELFWQGSTSVLQFASLVLASSDEKAAIELLNTVPFLEIHLPPLTDRLL